MCALPGPHALHRPEARSMQNNTARWHPCYCHPHTASCASSYSISSRGRWVSPTLLLVIYTHTHLRTHSSPLSNQCFTFVLLTLSLNLMDVRPAGRCQEATVGLIHTQTSHLFSLQHTNTRMRFSHHAFTPFLSLFHLVFWLNTNLYICLVLIDQNRRENKIKHIL